MEREVHQPGTWRLPPPLQAWPAAFQPEYSGYVPAAAPTSNAWDAWAGWGGDGGGGGGGDGGGAGGGHGAWGVGAAGAGPGGPDTTPAAVHKRLQPIDPAAYNEYDSQWSGWGGYRVADGEEGAKAVATDALWRWNVHTEVWERVDSAGAVLQVGMSMCKGGRVHDYVAGF